MGQVTVHCSRQLFFLMHTPGIWQAIGAAALFGGSTPFAKLLLSGLSPGLLAGLLYFGSGVGLMLLRLTLSQIRRSDKLGHGAGQEAPLTSSDWPWLGGAVLFGGVLGPLLLMVGLRATPAASASLLLNLEGVLTALLAWFVFKENFDRRIAWGMAFIVAGGALLSWNGGDASFTVGALAILAACACWAIDNNLTQKVSGGDPVQIAGIKGLVAGSVNTLLALAGGASWPSLPIFSGALLVGFFGYGLSLVLFVLALRYLGAARTGAYFSLAPFVGALVSLALLRESVTVTFWPAALLMAGGVWLHLTERHEHEHTHEFLEHAHRHVHDEHHQHEHSSGIDPREPHTHSHIHQPMMHKHPHYPDIHHRHGHENDESETGGQKQEHRHQS